MRRRRCRSIPNVVLIAAFAMSLLAALLIRAPEGASAAGLGEAQQKLEQVKQEAERLSAEIANEQQRLDDMDTEMASLGGRIAIAQSDYRRITQDLVATRERYAATEDERDQVQERLNGRVRATYIQGPGGSLEFLLNASSLSDLSARVEFMGALQAADTDVSVELSSLSATLKSVEAEAQIKQQEAQKTLEYVQRQTEQLEAKRAAAQKLLDSLGQARSRADELVRRWGQIVDTKERQLQTSGSGGPGPLYACPVPDYDWIANDFGAPRWGGGYHTHQGNDIGAAQGAPILAPFKGVASDASNDLGGLSVYVRGSEGYVYNAHLSAMGKLGNVDAGDVIGYVGNTGDAQGGPYHDHFEWHPGNGAAVDPYPSLMEVC